MWPAFLRRRVLFHRARSLLDRGRLEESLVILRDPLLVETRTAVTLRARAEELLAARAADAAPGTTLPKLLAQMRAGRGKPQSRAGADRQGARDGRDDREGTAGEGGPERIRGSAPRFRLAIDDAGEYAAVVGTELVIGHLNSVRADLPFLADVEREHARLSLGLDFHAGSSWRLEPLGRGSVVVGGQRIGAEGTALVDGDEVRLGRNLAFLFRSAEPASGSCVLDLLHGAECFGAPRVLVFAPGAEGRVRIGNKRARQIVVTGLEHEIALEMLPPTAGSEGLVRARLSIACAGGTRIASDDSTTTEARIDCPPRTSTRVTVGARAASRAPFAIVISALDELAAPSGFPADGASPASGRPADLDGAQGGDEPRGREDARDDRNDRVDRGRSGT